MPTTIESDRLKVQDPSGGAAYIVCVNTFHPSNVLDVEPTLEHQLTHLKRQVPAAAVWMRQRK
jgi:hypothetical protein